MITNNTKFLIIGLGTIGGSYAVGLKNRGYTVYGIDTDPETVQYAKENNMVTDAFCTVQPQIVNSADVVVFAVYPHIFSNWVEEYQNLLKPGTLVTDVTGVKGCIVHKIQSMLRSDCEFISAHPMAGSEKPGIKSSTDKIFNGANYIVVPTEKNTEKAITTCKQIGEILNFGRISELTVHEHDEMIGFVSQLTHCIAVTLMTCNELDDTEKYTGDSFRDLTRIANINDVMWSELFLLNKDALLHQMKLFTMEFARLERMLMESDREGIQKMMIDSTKKRKLFDKTQK